MSACDHCAILFAPWCKKKSIPLSEQVGFLNILASTFEIRLKMTPSTFLLGSSSFRSHSRSRWASGSSQFHVNWLSTSDRTNTTKYPRPFSVFFDDVLLLITTSLSWKIKFNRPPTSAHLLRPHRSLDHLFNASRWVAWFSLLKIDSSPKMTVSNRRISGVFIIRSNSSMNANKW